MRTSYKKMLISMLLVILVISLSACTSKKGNTHVKDGSNITSKDNNVGGNSQDTKDSATNGNSDKNGQQKQIEESDNTEKLDVKALEKKKVRLFSEKALFGATVTMKINDKNIEAKSVYYQVFGKNEPLTKQVELNKSTTMYPVAKTGTNVQVKFYDKNKKMLFNEETIIENK